MAAQPPPMPGTSSGINEGGRFSGRSSACSSTSRRGGRRGHSADAGDSGGRQLVAALAVVPRAAFVPEEIALLAKFHDDGNLRGGVPGEEDRPSRPYVGVPSRDACGMEPQRKRGVDLQVAQQERALVEPFSPQPAGHLVVALAGVAGAAGRHDVVERVAPATGERQYAVALQRLVGRAAVCAATPSRLECVPLLVAQVMLDAIHPALASAGGPGLATPLTAIAREYGPPISVDRGYAS